MTNAVVDLAVDTLDTAWTMAVVMFLKNAPHPETWEIKAHNEDTFQLRLGKKSFGLRSMMEASMLQGCLTVAWFAVNTE